MSEWPLISFTILLELACGSAMASTLSDWVLGKSDLVPIRPLGISVFPIAALALMASLFHLGRPFFAWRALSNLGHSRLSLEVLLSTLFVLSAFFYSYLWWSGRTYGRPETGMATCMLGTAAVVSSAVIYLVPAQPAWNSGWVPCALLSTVFLLGGLYPFLFSAVEDGPLRKLFLGVILAGGAALLASVAWMLVWLSQLPADEFVAAGLREGLHLLTSRYGVWLGLHVVLAGALPLTAAVRLWRSSDPQDSGALERRLLFLGVFLGVVIGRALMFALASVQNRKLPTL